jgi:CRP-like cAMP-binding protein
VDPFEKVVVGNLLFKTLDAAARQQVMALAKRRRYQRGQNIIQEGAPDQDIYLLRQGKVEVQTVQEGFIIELSIFEPGTVFGEVAAAEQTRRTATVVAKGDVEVLVFPGPELVTVLREHPTAAKLLEHITHRRVEEKKDKTFAEE